MRTTTAAKATTKKPATAGTTPAKGTPRQSADKPTEASGGSTNTPLPESVRTRLEAMSKENCVPVGELQAILLDYALESVSAHGIRVPELRQETEIPPVCVMATVREADALRIAEKAYHLCADKHVVAGVFAEAGSFAIRPMRAMDSEIGDRGVPIWMAINRDPGDFTTRIPVFMPTPDMEQAAQDAHQMKRDLGDWIGTLIMLGAEHIDSEAFTTAMVGYRALGTLCKANELEMIEETECAQAHAQAKAKRRHENSDR